MLDDTSAAFIAALTRGDTDTADRLETILDTVTALERAQREAPDRTARAARAYTGAGIAVFPIEPRGKRPLTPHGFKDATLDPAQVEAWWRQWPDANIGLPTGITFDVVDIDGREGLVSLYNGPTPIVDSLTVLGVASTSRDGGRHLYVPVSGRGNRASIYPGVDYRGEGGYVVAPPSIGANGRRYEWRQHLEPVSVRAA